MFDDDELVEFEEVDEDEDEEEEEEDDDDDDDDDEELGEQDIAFFQSVSARLLLCLSSCAPLVYVCLCVARLLIHSVSVSISCAKSLWLSFFLSVSRSLGRSSLDVETELASRRRVEPRRRRRRRGNIGNSLALANLHCYNKSWSGCARPGARVCRPSTSCPARGAPPRQRGRAISGAHRRAQLSAPAAESLAELAKLAAELARRRHEPRIAPLLSLSLSRGEWPLCSRCRVVQGPLARGAPSRRALLEQCRRALWRRRTLLCANLTGDWQRHLAAAVGDLLREPPAFRSGRQREKSGLRKSGSATAAARERSRPEQVAHAAARRRVIVRDCVPGAGSGCSRCKRPPPPQRRRRSRRHCARKMRVDRCSVSRRRRRCRRVLCCITFRRRVSPPPRRSPQTHTAGKRKLFHVIKKIARPLCLQQIVIVPTQLYCSHTFCLRQHSLVSSLRRRQPNYFYY